MDHHSVNARIMSHDNGDIEIKHERYPYEAKLILHTVESSKLTLKREEYIGDLVIQETNVTVDDDGEVILKREEKPGEVVIKETGFRVNKDTSIEMYREIEGERENEFFLTEDGEFRINSKDEAVIISSKDGDLNIEVTGKVNIIRKE